MGTGARGIREILALRTWARLCTMGDSGFQNKSRLLGAPSTWRIWRLGLGVQSKKLDSYDGFSRIEIRDFRCFSG